MKLLFLGGTRFIGLAAVEKAAARGHEVAVLHRGVHGSPLPRGVRELKVDRDDAAAVAAAVRAERPDAVVDTWAMSAKHARRAIEALEATGPRVVLLSSLDVYAHSNGLPAREERLTESSPLGARAPSPAEGEMRDDYDKQEVERLYARAAGRTLGGVVTLRLPAVFGRRDYQRRLGAFVDRLDAGEREFPAEDGGRWCCSHGHVDNAAHAIVLAAESRLGGAEVFNVGEAQVPSMRARVEKIAGLMGLSAAWRRAPELPEELAPLRKAAHDFVADTSKIRDMLGYRDVLDEDACYSDLIDWSRRSRRGLAA